MSFMEAREGGWASLWQLAVKQGIFSHSFVRQDTKLFTSVMKSHLFTDILLILRASFCITRDCPGKRKRNHQKMDTIDVVTPLASFARRGEEDKESSKSNSLRI